jgi:glucokinase
VFAGDPIMIEKDPRIVLTLDAGGTNFVFSAVRGGQEAVNPITLPSMAADLGKCLETIVRGFRGICERCDAPPAAISFAFPGPADYPAGIIGNLGNLPAFRGGVPLGPMLEDRFGVPVFINNDGDLFAYGEAIAGFLPFVNDLLEKSGNPKRFRNLFGATLGTGFGGGIVRDARLFVGDNSAAGEVWLLRNKLDPAWCAEEGVSIRAVRRAYAKVARISLEDCPEPKDIFSISRGELPGDRVAAAEAFRRLGEAAGDAFANVVTLIDSLVVIGGGLCGAHPMFLPALVNEMNRAFASPAGAAVNRMEMRAFNLENGCEREVFLKGDVRDIPVPDSGRVVRYDGLKRIGVGISRLGTSQAVAVGAYAFAIDALRSAHPLDGTA